MRARPRLASSARLSRGDPRLERAQRTLQPSLVEVRGELVAAAGEPDAQPVAHPLDAYELVDIELAPRHHLVGAHHDAVPDAGATAPPRGPTARPAR